MSTTSTNHKSAREAHAACLGPQTVPARQAQTLSQGPAKRRETDLGTLATVTALAHGAEAVLR
jgi:hypothetical protein